MLKYLVSCLSLYGGVYFRADHLAERFKVLLLLLNQRGIRLNLVVKVIYQRLEFVFHFGHRFVE